VLFDLPLRGFLGGLLGVGIGAFLVTGALAGRDGVVDLARRAIRWRVPLRWYRVALFTVAAGATLISLAIYGASALTSPSGGWPQALAEVAADFGASAGAVSACRRDRIHRISPTPSAGPVSPHEAHLVRGAAVGCAAHARHFGQEAGESEALTHPVFRRIHPARAVTSAARCFRRSSRSRADTAARSHGRAARHWRLAAGVNLIPGSCRWSVVGCELRADLFENWYGFVGVGARGLVECVFSEREVTGSPRRAVQ
jgi:hypothetical protein